MKNFCFWLLILSSSVLNAQTTASVVTSGGKVVGVFGNINAAVIPVIKPDNTEGSPFLSDDWNKGTVTFKKGKRADSILLKYSIVNNELYFMQDSITMMFLEEVFFFKFNYTQGSAIKSAYFKSGYPDEGAFNAGTFYQVYTEGDSFHLLKHLRRVITEQYVYNEPPKKSYVAQDSWYVYDVEHSHLIPIKPGKSAILKKLPALSARIEDLCKKNNWDLKSADEMTALFTELNHK